MDWQTRLKPGPRTPSELLKRKKKEKRKKEKRKRKRKEKKSKQPRKQRSIMFERLPEVSDNVKTLPD